MKKIVAILSLMAFASTMAMAMDGDTYRAERERVEALANSGYSIQQTGDNEAQIVDATAKSGKTQTKRRKRFFSFDTNSYYHFGAFTRYKGSNGH